MSKETELLFSIVQKDYFLVYLLVEPRDLNVLIISSTKINGKPYINIHYLSIFSIILYRG